MFIVQIGLRGEYLVSGGGLEGHYKAVMIEFHWGLDDISGSEHTIDGVPRPLEVHDSIMYDCFKS